MTMRTTHKISAEELARLFYQYREMLARDYGFQSSEGVMPWEEIAPERRNLMVAAATLVLHELEAVPHELEAA